MQQIYKFASNAKTPVAPLIHIYTHALAKLDGYRTVLGARHIRNITSTLRSKTIKSTKNREMRGIQYQCGTSGNRYSHTATFNSESSVRFCVVMCTGRGRQGSGNQNQKNRRASRAARKGLPLYMLILEDGNKAKEEPRISEISTKSIFQTHTRCVGLLYRANLPLIAYQRLRCPKSIDFTGFY